MTPLQQIVILLPQLTNKEKRDLRLLVDSQVKSSLESKINKVEKDWLLPGIERQMRQRGLLCVAVPPRQIGRNAPFYEKDAASVRSWFEKRISGPKRLQYANFLEFGEILAEALIDYLRVIRSKKPIDIWNVLWRVKFIPAAIEWSYPGYLSAGMFHMTLGSMRRLPKIDVGEGNDIRNDKAL